MDFIRKDNGTEANTFLIGGKTSAVGGYNINAVEDLYDVGQPHVKPNSSTIPNGSYMNIGNQWAQNKIYTLIMRSRRNKFTEPNDFVKQSTSFILDTISKMSTKLLFINPTAEGGAIVEFEKNGKQFLVEVSNEKEIVLLKRSTTPMQAEDLTEDNYKEHLQAAITNAS